MKGNGRDLSFRRSAFLITAVLILTLVGCSQGGEEESSEPVPFLSDVPLGTIYLNALTPPEGSLMREIPSLVHRVQERNALNSDTVGWLQVPNTNVDDVVVYYDDGDTAKPNDYYLRRNFEKKYSFDGIFFADFMNHFDGTAEGLTQNTIIYGHSMDDDYENGRLFTQLKRFDPDLNPDAEQFARENPYVYFSLEEEDLAWEIFAVFDATTYWFYNNAVPTENEFLDIINEATRRSKYIYDVQVSADDRILTLSTCTYKYDSRADNQYRYVIMARLVERDTPLNQAASLIRNDNPKGP